MQPLKRIRVVGWRDLSWRDRCIGGPHRDDAARKIVAVHGANSRRETTNWAGGFGGPLGEFGFELCPPLR